MKLNNPPQIHGNQAKVQLNRLDLASYQDLINLRTLPVYDVKGDEVHFPASYLENFYQENITLPLPVTDRLFDYQQVVVKVGFIKERYAIFADAGLGKTYVLGELARQIYTATMGKIIICIPLNILHQFEEMVQEFWPDFPPFDHLHGGKLTVEEWCVLGENRIGFVNHEAFIKLQKLRNVEAFLLDEASILKGGQGGNGKIAQHIVKAVSSVACRRKTYSPSLLMKYIE